MTPPAPDDSGEEEAQASAQLRALLLALAAQRPAAEPPERKRRRLCPAPHWRLSPAGACPLCALLHAAGHECPLCGAADSPRLHALFVAVWNFNI